MSKAPKKKHQITARIAAGLLTLAVLVGAVAWVNRSDDSGPNSSGGDAVAKASPGSTPTAAAEPTLKVPKKLVDPLKGSTYCATAKLLAVYTRQSYGLNEKLGFTDGKKFDKRLSTIAATFDRLATQARGTKKAQAQSSAWAKAAKKTWSTEDAFKAAGSDVTSDVMIVELAKLKKTITTEIPKATSTLQAACGLSPSLLGL